MQRGLKEKKEQSRYYMTIARGMFVKRVAEETQSSVPRELEKGENKGKVVHEEFYDEFVGQLLDIKLDSHPQFGKSWEFIFDITEDENDPKQLVLKANYSSGYAKNILTRLPNLDLSKDVAVKGYCFTPEDSKKEKMGITLFQVDDSGNREKVLPAFTKENPGDLPEMTQVKVKGQTVWDDTAQCEFFEKMVEDKFGSASESDATEEPEAEEESPF